MNQTNKKRILGSLAAAALVLAVGACGQEQGGETAAPSAPGQSGPVSPGQSTGPAAPSTGAPTGSPTQGATTEATVVAALGHRVEMEKATHDLYAAFGRRYAQPAFDRVASAETRHRAVVAGLLAAAGEKDPSAGLPAGEFAAADVQRFYDRLLAQGQEDVDEAFDASEHAEERTIAELRDLLATDGLPTEVRTVAEHLLTASRAHLEAFDR